MKNTHIMAFLVAIVICGASTNAIAGDPNPPSPELRGIWVDGFHDGVRTPEQTTEMVNKVADANLNAIFVQVRKRGDAYYNSSIVPKAKEIAPDYDPLGDVIQKSHAKGIEVHAWINPLCIWYKGYGRVEGNVFFQHPEWLTKTDYTDSIYARGDNVYLDPGLPGVRQHLADVVREIVTKYAVDGICVDGLRYANGRLGYNDTAVQAFNTQYKREGKPKFDDADWCTWRRQQITLLAKAMSDSVKAVKPKLKITASVCNSKELEFKQNLADWTPWFTNGYVDAILPMVYFDNDELFDRWATEAVTAATGRHAYISLDAWRLNADVTAKQVSALRTKGSAGFVIFSYAYASKAIDPAGGTALDAVKSQCLPTKAEVPAMAWKQQPPTGGDKQ